MTFLTPLPPTPNPHPKVTAVADGKPGVLRAILPVATRTLFKPSTYTRAAASDHLSDNVATTSAGVQFWHLLKCGNVLTARQTRYLMQKKQLILRCKSCSMEGTGLERIICCSGTTRIDDSAVLVLEAPGPSVL